MDTATVARQAGDARDQILCDVAVLEKLADEILERFTGPEHEGTTAILHILELVIGDLRKQAETLSRIDAASAA